MKKRFAYLCGGLFVVLSATAVIAQTAPPEHPPAAPGCDPVETVEQAEARSALISGDAVAISGNRLVSVATAEVLEVKPCGDETEGVLRHLSVLPGAEAAYVVDQAGQDVLNIVGSQGSMPMTTAGEISHPTWSADGRLVWAENLQVLKIMSADRTSVDGVVLPAGTVTVFSPLFSAEDEITAVVQEKGVNAPPEDESLNNLWSFDLSTRRWERQTDFAARGPRWSAIRTPIVTDGGDILFVRIAAHAQKTTQPRFELWVSDDGGARKVEDLPREMYLAGWTEDGPLWNMPSRTCGDWGLFAEVRGELEEIGCGGVMTDPLAIPDPDLLVDEHTGEHAGEHAGETENDLVIVVGDFASATEARSAAGRVEGPVSLLSHRDAPSALRPGAWGLMVELGGASDAEARLEAVRSELGGCGCGAWLAPRP